VLVDHIPKPVEKKFELVRFDDKVEDRILDAHAERLADFGDAPKAPGTLLRIGCYVIRQNEIHVSPAPP
jgi:hypothetical protein